MLDRRAVRLARCFQLVAFSLGIPGAWLACTTPADVPRGSDPDAAPGTDSTIGNAETDSPVTDAVVADAPFSTKDAADAPDAGRSCWATVSASDSGPDHEEVCHFVLPCGLANEGLTSEGCAVIPAQPDGAPDDVARASFPNCRVLDGKGCTDGSYAPTEAGVEFECIGCPGGGGRRPSGFQRARARGKTAAGAYFAELAQLEAASVHAFEALADELALHRAPSALVDAARASAGDERRHAAAMAGLARRFGAAPTAPKVRKVGGRSIASIARENAVEGCVRETFGALLNAWQASHACDPEVRAVMATIARDELRHAALSWEIATWANQALSASARRKVARGQRRAVARLVSAAAREPSPALRAISGLPDGATASGLARGLAEHLWTG